MKTIEIKVFQFDELGEDAKQKAIQWFRNGNCEDDIYSREIIGSAKKVAELFNLKFGREYTDIRTSHIDDDILQLSGIRLYKYLVNNYWYSLFKPVYIKSIDRPLHCKQFICKIKKDYKGSEYTSLYSKQKRDNSCVLTGVCYDDDILKPVYSFLTHPDNSTFEDIISEIESAISKVFRDTEEWINSDEYIIDAITANEYEFTETGKRF